MKLFLQKNTYLSLVVLVGALTLLFVCAVRGPLLAYPDTKVYVGQVKYFAGEIEADMDIQLRSFKPFYGAVGAAIHTFTTPEISIFSINIVFFFGLIIASYVMLKEIGFSQIFAAIGASWVATGYPLLKYGLALLTDISGWFFAAATIATFLVGIRKGRRSLLILASVIGFAGSLCKETGLLGLGFAGLYLVLHFIKTRQYIYLRHLLAISVPFIVLQTTFLYILFTKSTTHTSFIQWFFFNKEGVGYELHTLYYFILTELSTFSLLLLYAVVGTYSLYKNRHTLGSTKIIIGISLLAAVLPPLVWPVFLTRVLYIGYLVVVPLALVGLSFWQTKYPHKRKLFLVLAALPIMSSIVLFLLAGNDSLFLLLGKLFSN